MKHLYFLLMAIIFISCKSVDIKNHNNCNEHIEFKEKFFYHIKYVENNISVPQDSTFKASVIFLSNYAPVSVNHMMNYARTYPMGIFERDRIKILAWYEENKCNHIKFKESYIMPEAYQYDED